MPDNDDEYVLEDTGETLADIEKEMEVSGAGGAPPPSAASSEEVAKLNDRYLRTLADFENYRKRSDREKEDFRKHALANALRDLLPVLDNFDRSLEHAEEGDDFHKGVLLIYKQLWDVLQKSGVRTIDEVGVKFNPNIHEAVMREENPDVPSQTVTAILQKGYYIHDRLLRPALVKVAVGGPEHHDDVH
ncbi:MAG TPA: nucleotide exchange factor GrpE [Thermoanaerobaculia bacterium]|nr:nucleotide exchange factor GrpE [Thermoanaerobaculia bacterium]